MLRAFPVLLCILCLTGCSAVSPRPEAIAAIEHAPAQLDAADRAECERRTAEALQALAETRYPQCEALATAALALDPAAARARAALGVALLMRAQQATPPDLLLQNRGDGETLAAARAQPADPVVGLLRARFLAQAGHRSAAAAAGEQCLAASTTNSSQERTALLAAVADWCFELGEEQRALKWLRSLVEQRPDDAQAQYRLGVCLLQTADDAATAAGAARAFARSAAARTDDLEAACAVASAFARAAELAEKAGKAADAAGHWAEAGKACAAAAERFPKAAAPWFCAGAIAEQQRDPAAAQSAYEQALAREPAHIPSLLNAAALLAAGKQPADRRRANELWRRALAADDATHALRAGERARIEARLSTAEGPGAGGLRAP